jgi:hypothetical protein
MTDIVKLAGRAMPALVLAIALGACDRADPTSPTDTAEPAVALEAASVAPSFSRSFRGGIPFGVYHLPKHEYGKVMNGSLANLSPSDLISYLEAARQSGTRIMLSTVGRQTHYRNKDHSFSLALWKQRVDRFRGVDFSSYIADGTIIGHYLLDEPHDKGNWGGATVSPAILDEMARHSKQLWPSMATVVRAWPDYLQGYNYKYLDAAWAQYSPRYGASSQRLPVKEFISRNVSQARGSGLALVVGMNLLAGGSSRGLGGYYPGQLAPSASDLREFGSALLESSYACAFISWRHDDKYMSRPEIAAAMSELADKARSHPYKSCRGEASRGNGGDEETPPPPPSDEGGESPPPDVETPPPPAVETPTQDLVLSVKGSVKDKRRHMTLTWTGANGRRVDVYRNGVRGKNTENDGRYVNAQRIRGPVVYQYKVCEQGTSTCSNVATVSFQ